MTPLFSKRTREAPQQYRYNLPHEVRSRILYAMKQVCGATFDEMLDQMENRLLREYGGLSRSPYAAARSSNIPIIEHFLSCNEPHALDFVEACFQEGYNCGQQEGVDAINEILRESAVGFQLTPFTMTERPVQVSANRAFMAFGRSRPTVDVQYPQFVRVDSQYLYSEAVQPTLQLLADAKYRGANQEFIDAHQHFRHGRNKECINECLKALESTLKTICHNKGWAYKDTDTAKPLIKACLDNGLIPAFNQEQLMALSRLLESGVPTTRNKTSGHGQGVRPIDVPEHVAQYALHLTAAAILLLIQSAK